MRYIEAESHGGENSNDTQRMHAKGERSGYTE